MQPDEFNKTQKEIMAERVNSAERAGWFSGAAFSLSLTLIGFLVSQQSLLSLLRADTYTLDSLVLGWGFLWLSIVASLLPRLWNARWLFNNSWDLYFASFTKFETDELKKQHDELRLLAQGKAEIYSKLFRIITDLVYVGAILGFSSLAFFLIHLASLIL